jgi:SPW repeat
MANNASLRGDEKNVQDWINLICGILLFVSPWALGFSGDLMAARAAWVGGVVIFLWAPLHWRSSPSGRNG